MPEQRVTAQLDSSILHEIVGVIDSRGKVPERVKLRGRSYQVTYLEDHKQRLEEAIRRHDPDRLNMLYGQLASKVKYQLLGVERKRTGTAKKTAGTSKSSKSGRVASKTAAPRKTAKPGKKKVASVKKGKPRTVRAARG